MARLQATVALKHVETIGMRHDDAALPIFSISRSRRFAVVREDEEDVADRRGGAVRARC
jgi:hypothetical protein